MKNFLSCDWGTSSFRLRYVDTTALTFTEIRNPDQGIAKLFDWWKQSGRKEEERFSFYSNVINEHIKTLEQQLKFPVHRIPLVISGMASSSMGMTGIAYKDVPFLADGSDLELMKIKGTGALDHDILMISGAKTATDVMRGEETQLAGCIHQEGEERLFIFPGTHSKHILVKNGRVIHFKTYMTGEFFDMLSKKSILATAVVEGEGLKNSKNKDSFEKGVTDSAASNLLHTAFLIRTNELFDKLTKQENYYYLSGLLIGMELGDTIKEAHQKVTLVVDEGMKLFYKTALNTLGLWETDGSFEVVNADLALIKGQLNIWKMWQRG